MSTAEYQPPVWDEGHLPRALQADGVALWSWNVDDDSLAMDEAAFGLWGIPVRLHVTFEDLSAHIHPRDRDRVRAAFAATRAVVGPYEIDFRIIVDGDVRWVSARGQGDDLGMVSRKMFGIFIDVTGRKQAEVTADDDPQPTHSSTPCGTRRPTAGGARRCLNRWHSDTSGRD